MERYITPCSYEEANKLPVDEGQLSNYLFYIERAIIALKMMDPRWVFFVVDGKVIKVVQSHPEGSVACTFNLDKYVDDQIELLIGTDKQTMKNMVEMSTVLCRVWNKNQPEMQIPVKAVPVLLMMFAYASKHKS